MKRVLISDKMSEKAIEAFKRFPDIQVDYKTGLKPDELKSIIKDYDGLAIRSSTKVTAEIIEAATNLKVIGRAGIGVDNVDIPAASKSGVIVMNTPYGNTTTTAEHAISMMLALARDIPQATSSTKAAKWEKNRFMGKEITNKTLGVIGIGNIGSIVVNRAQGLKMNVIAYDPFISPDKALDLGVELVTLDDLYKRADFISLHIPLTKDTKDLLNKDSFAKMKDGVMVVNCARGGIINENDLAEAINSGKVRGAALDVFEKEPPAADNPLLALEQVICTPHLGASTDEAQENVAVDVAEQIADYLVNGTIRNALNVPSVSGDVMKKIAPYLTLVEKMGSFHAQLAQGGIEEVVIEYSGDVAAAPVAPMTISALKGLLTPIVGEMVNFVNAPIMAKDRGIKVVESRTSEPEDFSSLITMKVKTNNGENTLAGTLFGKKEPRIVKINNFYLEAIPEGIKLFIYNHDRPGVIGNIGTLMGKNNVNIGTMEFGRDKVGGMAISLLSIDSTVSDAVMEEIKKLPNIVSAIQIML